MSREAHEQNRRSWNAATRAHNRHKRDQAGFLRDGGTTLFPDELELLGDLTGTRLVHLQCNAGQDTLCLARYAAEVTGVDISDEAIRFARRLSRESGIPASFERADLYDWFEMVAADEARRFDVAFSSYGAIPWLSDLPSWARGIASLLAPSGFVAGGAGFVNPEPCVEYFWGTSLVIQALVDAGLRLQRFVEYPYANGFKPAESMRELPGRRFAAPEGMPDLPLMWGLVARKG